jgi:hypothetical protein
VTGEIVRRTEDGQRAVAQEFVDMPTCVDDRRHDNLEQSIESGDRVFGGVRLGERGEITDCR